MIASGADHHINIRNSRGIKITFKLLFRKLLSGSFSIFYLKGVFIYCPKNLIPASVAYCHLTGKSFAVGCHFHGLFNSLPGLFIQTLKIPHNDHLNVPFNAGIHLFHEKALHDIEKSAYFLYVAVPVFCGKGIDRKILYAKLFTPFTGIDKCIDSLFMAFKDACKHVFSCPAPVAIHDNSKMCKFIFRHFTPAF